MSEYSKMAKLLSPCPYCGSPALAGKAEPYYRIDCGDGECAVAPSVKSLFKSDAINFWETKAVKIAETRKGARS